MQKLLSNKKVICLFVLPGLLLFLSVYVIPIIATVGLSFTEWDLASSPKFIGLQNYITMFTEDPVFLTGIKNTGILIVAVLFIQIPLALGLALLLANIKRGSRLIKASLFIPVLFSATAVGILWRRVFDYNFGVLNAIFDLFGSNYQQMWLSDPASAIFAVCIPLIWCKIGYYIIIFYAGIKAIPKDYFEAALLDGCTGIRATVKVTLPLLRNVTSACLILGAIGALREYPLIYALTNGGPYNSTMTPAMEMYVRGFIYTEFGYASALAVMLIVLCLVTTGILNKVYPAKDIKY